MKTSVIKNMADKNMVIMEKEKVVLNSYVIVKGKALNDELDMHPMYHTDDVSVVFKNKQGKLYNVDMNRLIQVFNNNICNNKKSVK